MNLEPRSFDYLDNVPSVGLVAQEILEKTSFGEEMVEMAEDGYYRIQNDKLYLSMINAIKELNTTIVDLTRRLEEIESLL